MKRSRLALELDVHYNTVGNWEKGKNRPQPGDLAKLRKLSPPELHDRIDQAIRDFDWHPGAREGSDASGTRIIEVSLPSELAAKAEQAELDISCILREALSQALAARSHAAAAKRQASFNKGASGRGKSGW